MSTTVIVIAVVVVLAIGIGILSRSAAGNSALVICKGGGARGERVYDSGFRESLSHRAAFGIYAMLIHCRTKENKP